MTNTIIREKENKSLLTFFKRQSLYCDGGDGGGGFLIYDDNNHINTKYLVFIIFKINIF